MKDPLHAQARVTTSWRILIAVLISLSCAPTVGIGDDNEEDPAAVRIEPRFRITGQHFDQLIFGGRLEVVRENGKTITRSSSKTFKPSLESAYAMEIERLANECKLSHQQKKKLQLAARGDVVRLMNRIEVLRDKSISTELNQVEYATLVAELQGLSYAARLMISSPSSLFRKSLRRCLTPEQKFLYAAAEHNRQIAMLERALDQLDRTNSNRVSLKLTPEIRRRFIEIMLANTKLPPTTHPYSTQIIFVEAAKQEGRLSSIFTQSQWENFQRQLDSARQMEADFQRMGVWPLPTWNEEFEISDVDGN